MKCSQLNTKEEKGIIIDMNNKKDMKNKKQEKGVCKQSEPLKGKKERNGYIVPKSTLIVLSSVVGVSCTAILTLLGWIVIQINTVNSTIAENKTNISNIMNDTSVSEKIGKMEEKIDKVNEDLNGDGSDEKPGLAAKVYAIEKLLEISPIFATSDIISFVDGVSKEPNNINEVGSSVDADTCIGTDAEGNIYLAEDLINETILLTYTEEDKEVYFLGQYNEDYKWNGYCVTNAYYTDGTLYGICESNFDDGKRLDYKSFVLTKKDEWIYSDKVCNDEVNSGVNILYSLNYDKVKNFTGTNVRIADMLYTDEFIEATNPTMLKYYSGNTGNEKYNDDSGKAYEIKYDKDGTVTLLYVGRFKDGTFNDMTGNAWEIVYAEKYGYYVYNTGNFKDGHTDNPSGKAINIDEITQIISGYDFSSELKWKCE